MRRSRPRALFALLALGVSVGAPSAAHAFCRTTTVKVPADFQPSPTACFDKGLPLWWKNACVGYSMHRAASRYVAYDDAAQIITRAFTKWSGSSCPTSGSGPSRVSIDVRDLGPVDCGAVDYNSTLPNQHVIVFRDDEWPHNDASNTLALTTVVFNPETGELYDADMEVNTYQHKMTLQDPVPADGYDFASIMTHETGHFLGLAHSGDREATMFASYTPGATKMRNLTADDVNGICTVYGPDGARTVGKSVAPSGKIAGEACEPFPRHGFSVACAEPPPKGCFGAVSPSARPERGVGLVGLGLAVLALARRRLRRA